MRHAKVAANWLTFETDAQVWISELPLRPRRPLIAASVGLELAQVQRASWQAARMLVEAGCALLQQQAPSSDELLWHRAALELAASLGDFDLLIDNPDLSAEQRKELGARRAAVVTQMRERKSDTLPAQLFQFLAHGDHASARFPAVAELRLQAAVAYEFNRVGRNETLFVARDVPIWMDADAVERLITAGRAEVFKLPSSRRMDPAAALRLLSTAPMVAAARRSLMLWNVADRYGGLVDDPAVSAEAHLRLGQTLVRLARPTPALAEFAKAEQTTDASVRYLAHLFAGAVNERIGQRSQAISSLSSALRVLPRAQSATFALAPLLLEAGQPEMAAEIMEAAVAQAPVPDPLHDYWTGDVDRWSHAVKRLREALR